MAVYLDHAATTPMTDDVRHAFVEALGVVGNPSSIHSQGQAARRVLEEARESLAESLDCDSVEVVFTSGGTESINLAMKGLWWSRRRPRVVIPAAEHHATLDAADWLERHEAAVVDRVAVDGAGRLDLDDLARALQEPETVSFLSLLTANNEVGTLQPVAEVVALAAGVPVHADVVGSFGQLPFRFRGSGLAAASVSAHKVGGPVGVGALLVARGTDVTPLLHGGSQQSQRSGTMDVAGAVAFATAARLAVEDLDAHAAALAALRDRLVAGVLATVPTAVLRGDPTDRLPGNAHFTFAGCEGDSLIMLLDLAGFSVSTGSACRAGVPEASHVLLAMGVSEQDARGALRVTLGAGVTAADVDAFVAALPAAVQRASAAGLAERMTRLGR